MHLQPGLTLETLNFAHTVFYMSVDKQFKLVHSANG